MSDPLIVKSSTYWIAFLSSSKTISLFKKETRKVHETDLIDINIIKLFEMNCLLLIVGGEHY